MYIYDVSIAPVITTLRLHKKSVTPIEMECGKYMNSRKTLRQRNSVLKGVCHQMSLSMLCCLPCSLSYLLELHK